MGHLSHKASRGAARETRIGIEGNHVADPARHGGRSATNPEEGRVRRAAKPPIQLVQLPALALPPYPLPLSLVPGPSPVEEEKSITVGCRSVTLVQARDSRGGRAEELVVVLRALRCGVRPVREQSQPQIVVGAREEVDFETLDLLLD